MEYLIRFSACLFIMELRFWVWFLQFVGGYGSIEISGYLGVSINRQVRLRHWLDVVWMSLFL